MGRRHHTRLIDLLSDIADEIRDFLDDEVVERGRDSERDLRRAGRRWTDGDRGAARRRDELDDLRDALAGLSRRVDALVSERIAAAPVASGEPTPAEPVTAAEPTPAEPATAETATAETVDEKPVSPSSIAEKVAEKTSEKPAETANPAAGNPAEKPAAAKPAAKRAPARSSAATNQEPWDGYDDQTVVEIRKRLSDASDELNAQVRAYETKHKNRQGVLNAAGG